MQTPQELRELDAWIAQHLFGWTMIPSGKDSFGAHYQSLANKGHETILQEKIPHYTTDPASAMDVLRECIKKVDLYIFEVGGQWSIHTNTMDISEEAQNLELAVSKFAKSLYSKD